jgi:hypothetical protein
VQKTFRALKLVPLFVCSYNTIMKIVFLLSSCGIIYLMRFHKVIKVQREQELL